MRPNLLLFFRAGLFLVLIGAAWPGFSQNNGDEVILNGNVYVPGSAWFTVGAGTGYEGITKLGQRNFSLGFNFRANRLFSPQWVQPNLDWVLNCGYHYSAEDFLWKPSDLVFEQPRVNDLHVGLGLRKEGLKSNLSFNLGPSLALGWYHHDDSLNTGFRNPGLFTEFQYSWKWTYDIGLGATLFASINRNYQVVGAQVHIYLSTAYRGKIH